MPAAHWITAGMEQNPFRKASFLLLCKLRAAWEQERINRVKDTTLQNCPNKVRHHWVGQRKNYHFYDIFLQPKGATAFLKIAFRLNLAQETCLERNVRRLQIPKCFDSTIAIPEGAVKCSNTVRELQGASSTDLMASGKLFSGVRWSLIHNISSPEGVIFPITAKEIGNQTLGEHCRVDKLKRDYWTSIRQHLLHSAPQMSFGREKGGKWPRGNDLPHPQNIFCNN